MSSNQVVSIEQGDSLEKLKTLPDCSVDSVVTDPPYGLAKNSPKQVRECFLAWLSGEEWSPKGRGFMGRAWDAWVPPPELWSEVLRVLKPGGHALVFAGSRTSDLMGVSLRLAGFEVRDSLQWIYGSGFPKSHSVERALRKAGREEEADQWKGWGTALKPAYEPIILCRKPFKGTVVQNTLNNGVGALNIDGCRIATTDKIENHGRKVDSPIYSPLGAIEKGQSPGMELGRWPANILLDEEAGKMLDEQSGDLPTGKASAKSRAWGVGNEVVLSSSEEGVGWKAYGSEGYSDSGGASRFFYCSKAPVREKEAGLAHFESEGKRKNTHPTVKPLSLMKYLVRLITPKEGVVLDPFVGSGTTAIAANLEGFNFVGFEREEEFVQIAQARVAHWCKQ